MRLNGKVEIIEEVERLIIAKSKCFKNKNGSEGLHSQLNDDSSSRVFVRQYAVNVNGHLISVRMQFDYRSKTGQVQIKDEKVWKLITAIPSMARLFNKLHPSYVRGYHRRDGLRGSMDRLFG